MSSKLVTQHSKHSVEELNEELRNQGLTEVDPTTFCILPFVHLSTTTNGEIKLCCRSSTIASIQHETILDTWKGTTIDSIRADLLSGKRRDECQACWLLEDLGMVSLRQGQNIVRTSQNKSRIVSWLKSKDIMPIQNIELKLSNLCNLKCRMCSPIASTPWLREWEQVKDFYSPTDRHAIDDSYNFQKTKREPFLDFFMTNEKFMEDFSIISESVEELEFAGGEPLLDNLHYEVLKKVLHRASQITLKYSTNLMTLGNAGNSVLKLWPHFKEVKLTISIDGAPELNEYIRTGTNSLVLESNINSVRTMANVTLKASTCVSAYNALFLRETLEYIASLKIQWYSNRVRSPSFLDARVWPMELRATAAKQLQNIDLNDLQKMGYDLKTATQSLRTVHDCASWLNDLTLASRLSSEFDTFQRYVRKLDEIRKTNFQLFFKDGPPKKAIHDAFIS